jgi:hypothetical protein
VADHEWLARCGREGLVVLTKDKNIRRHPAEIAALVEHEVTAFVLASGQLPAAAQAQRFVTNADGIDRLGRAGGPLVVAVHAHRLVTVYPPRASP